MPRDKKSPGTRNPPGQAIPQDKQSPGTSNSPGNPRQELLGNPGKAWKIPGKAVKTREIPGFFSSIYIKWKQKKSVLPYLLPQF